MDKITRLRGIRKNLHLSHNFVSNYLKIDEETLSLLECGIIEPTDEELNKLSLLYGLPKSELIKIDDEDKLLKECGLTKDEIKYLNRKDRKEILNLISFKTRLKENVMNEEQQVTSPEKGTSDLKRPETSVFPEISYEHELS